MSRKRSWMPLIILLAVMMVTVIACGPEAVDEPDEPDEPDVPDEPAEPVELRMGLGSDATNLDPRHATDVASMNINNLVYMGLLQWDMETMEIMPYVAKEIEIPDDTTYIFHLHEGILFHDGVELTAEDVKYTYDCLRDPDFGGVNLAFYQPIVEINIIDDYTVEFKLDEPNAPFLYYLAPGIVPKHIAEGEDPDFFKSEPVGSGPYVFVEWVPNDYVVLEAFDDYFGGRPAIDRIVFRPIPEVTTRLIELETGGIHLVDGVPPEDVDRLDEDPEVIVTFTPGTGFNYFMYHCQTAPFDDVRVRQALAYGMDMEALVNHVFYGFREVAHSPIIPTSWAHNPDVRKFGHEPEKAMELLSDAGHPDGIEVELKLSEGEINRETCEIVQHQLADIGVTVNLLEQEWGAFLSEILDADFEMATLGWSGQTDPDRGVYRQFHSRNWAPGGSNNQHYANERVDELLDLARTNPDQEVRQDKYFEIQEILAEEQPYTYISYYVTIAAHRPEVQNYDGRCGYFYTRPLKNATLVE